MSQLPTRCLPLLLGLAACGQQAPSTAAPSATLPSAAAPATAMPPQSAAAPVTPPAGPDARTALLLLAPYAAQLARAPALQADTRVQQLSQQLLTQATALEQGPATARLQPTLRTLAELLQAAQQRAYPSLAAPARQLAAQVQALPDQPATAAGQRQYAQVLQQASDLLKQLIAQTPGAHH